MIKLELDIKDIQVIVASIICLDPHGFFCGKLIESIKKQVNAQADTIIEEKKNN